MTENEYLALPVAQRKEFQKELKAKGLYHGPIDGVSGDGIRTALTAMDREKAESEERARKGRIEEESAAAEAEKKKAEADRERAKAESERAATERKRQYGEEASSGPGIATQIATGPGAFVGGYGVGRGLGAGINKLADLSQESKNRVLQGAAQDRLSGLTTRDGARTGTNVAGAMPSQNALLRVGGRMLPHAITGGGMIGKGSTMLAQGNEDDPFYAQMANRGAGIGMIGTGVGIIEQGANYAVNPGVAPDARSIAIMESNQLRRGPGQRNALLRGDIVDADVIPNAPEAQKALPAPEAAPKEVTPGSKAYYAQEAKRLGLKGTTRMTKAQIVEAVNQANQGNAGKRVRGKKLPTVAGPLAAAGLAYMATPDRAEASADGSVSPDRTEALTNAGIAGGLTYGANKLLQAVPKAVGAGLTMTAPTMGADVYDPTTEEHNRDANIAARYFPSFMRAGAVEDAYQMAQVPERGVASSGPRVSRLPAEDARPLVTGEADDFDAQLAELSSIFAQLEAGDQPQPQAPAPLPVAPYAPQNRLLAGR